MISRLPSGEVDSIAQIIAIELGTTVETVLSCSSLRRELRMDSISAANILFALEERFDVSFEGVSMREMQTVWDIEGIIAAARRDDAKE